MTHLGVDRSPADVRYDKWMARFRMLVIFAFGLISGVTGMMVLGDSRYARREDFTALQKLQEHNATDIARFATKEDLASHTAQVGHPSTVDINRIQEGRIRRLEANQAWIANALYRMARRGGIQLPPPPELRAPLGLQGEHEDIP